MVVSSQERESVLKELHCGYPGISRMKSLACGLVWWPGIDKDNIIIVTMVHELQQMPTESAITPISINAAVELSNKAMVSTSCGLHMSHKWKDGVSGD